MGLEKKILNDLAIADIDYASARCLIMSGFPFTGYRLASECIEKILKLAISIIIKIEEGNELSPKEMRELGGRHGHDLLKLAECYNQYVPQEEKLVKWWDGFFENIKSTYSRRYSDNWKEHILKVDISELDFAYKHLRNTCSLNFPVALKEKSSNFGGFLSSIYNKDYLDYLKKNYNLITPDQAVTTCNLQLDEFNFDKNNLLGGQPNE